MTYDPANRDDQANVARGRIALPVAVLPEALRTAIGATSSIVRLSVADGAKQAAKRRTTAGKAAIAPPDYAIVQRLIDRAEVIKQGETDLVLQGEVEGKRWVAVLRRALAALGEIYLKSFRRQTDRQTDVYRARGEILRPASDDPAPRPADDDIPSGSGRMAP